MVTTKEEANARMQEAIKHWECRLKVMGGVLHPSNLFIYPMIYNWYEKSNHKLQNSAFIDISLIVKDDTGTEFSLEQKPSHIGKDTLCVFVAPDCSQIEKFVVLKFKITKWCEQARTGHLPATED